MPQICAGCIVARRSHAQWTALFRRTDERVEHRCRSGNRAENAALSLDHSQAHIVELGEIGGAAVRQHDATEAAIVGLTYRGIDADLGGDAADKQRLDVPVLENEREVGLVEGALPRLVDHRLARHRIKLGDDVVSGLAPHQDAAHRSGCANAQGGITALDLHARGICQVGAMAFPRVDDEHAGLPRRRQHVATWSHRRLEA